MAQPQPATNAPSAANGNDISTHNPALNKADLDVTYLKEKKIPALLESLAAEFIVHKPHDPESFLKNRFHVGSEGGIDSNGEPGMLTITTLCPMSMITKMAATRCTSVKLQVKELDPTAAAQRLPPSVSQQPGVGGAAGANGIGAIVSSGGFSFSAKDIPASPFGKTPCLEHSGLVLLEVGPVVRYLCHGTPYLPSTLRPRMKVEVAFDVIVANVLPSAMTAVLEKYVVPRISNRPVDAAAVQQAASKFRSGLVQLMGGGAAGGGAPASSSSTPSFFCESVWVAGREPSIADMALAAGLFSIQSVAGYDCITGLASLERWWEAVRGEQWYGRGLGDWQQLAASLHTR